MSINTISMVLAGWRIAKMHRSTSDGHLVTIERMLGQEMELRTSGAVDSATRLATLEIAVNHADAFADEHGGWTDEWTG